MNNGRKAAQVATTRGRIGQGKQRSEAGKHRLPASAALFLVVFDLSDMKSPRYELEYRFDGTRRSVYTPEVRAWFRESLHELRQELSDRHSWIALEGYARFPIAGFPSSEIGAIRHGIGRALRALLAEGAETVTPIRGSELDCQIRVLLGRRDVIERLAAIWQAGAVDSSSGMWNQALVPSSRSDEESAMHVAKKGMLKDAVRFLSADEVIHTLKVVNDRVSVAQRSLQGELQGLLNRLDGASFGSLEANQRVADGLRFLMQRLEVRVACPKAGCGQPALIRARRAGRSPHGTFGFEHRMGARIMAHAASTTLPLLTLVAVPPDRRRKSAKA